MGDYFQPLRRKIGVAILVLACLFAGGWVRSRWNADFIWYPSGTVGYSAESLHGVIRLYSATPAAPGRRFSFGSANAWSAPVLRFDDNGEPLPFNPWERLDVLRWSDWLGFSFCTGNIKNTNTKVEMCVIRYWFFVLPLTLLSVFLLLSNPRKSTPKKITEPVSEKVA